MRRLLFMLSMLLSVMSVLAPDLRENRNETQDTLYRSYDRYRDIYYSSGNGEQYSGIIMPILTDALNSTYDTASDRYSYNFGGKAGVYLQL